LVQNKFKVIWGHTEARAFEKNPYMGLLFL
jgi:hypothetical protein